MFRYKQRNIERKMIILRHQSRGKFPWIALFTKNRYTVSKTFHTNIMSTSTRAAGLAVVQDLYLMQIDLKKSLENDLSDPKERRHVREQVREFADLLDQADPAYMGGEDVLQDMLSMKDEVLQTIEQSKKR